MEKLREGTIAVSSPYKKWNQEEIDFLRENYGKIPIDLIVKYLGRTKNTIQSMASIKKIAKKIIVWKKEEIQFLKDNYKSMTIKEISNTLNRTFKSVEGGLKKFHINHKNIKWSFEEINFLKENYGKISINLIAEYLDRNKEIIRKMAFANKLSKKNIIWKKEEDDYIKENYKNMTSKELAKILNRRTSYIISNRIIKLGLNKNQKWTKEKILKVISDKSKELKRYPSYREFSLTFRDNCEYHFGSYSKALEILGYNKEDAKKVRVDKFNILWKNPEWKKNQIGKMLKGLMKRPTSYEKKISELCIENSLPFIYTGDGRFLVNYKNPDFIDENNKIAIEVFYSWYKIRDYGSVENYKEFCIKKYNSAGWKVIFIDENEVDVDNWKELCLKKIKDISTIENVKT